MSIWRAQQSGSAMQLCGGHVGRVYRPRPVEIIPKISKEKRELSGDFTVTRRPRTAAAAGFFFGFSFACFAPSSIAHNETHEKAQEAEGATESVFDTSTRSGGIYRWAWDERKFFSLSHWEILIMRFWYWVNEPQPPQQWQQHKYRL